MTDVEASRPWWLEAVVLLETHANDAEGMAERAEYFQANPVRLNRRASALRRAAAVLRATPEPK